MRALVIDDHPLIQEIVPAVLAKALGEVDVATESTLEAGIARASREEIPELVVLDLGLPGCEGLEALARFRSKFPEVPLVVFSGTTDRASIVAALEAGADGYIPKTSKPAVMIAALKVVAAGGTYVPPEALEDAVEEARPARRRRTAALDLTERQKQVLRFILKGYNNERIASELSIAPNTVKQHAHAIFTALGVSTRAEAVIAAARHGLSLG
ncbi:MAG TPA: response regulator transcription factor [Burkholderiales bacterium]|jgi:DNA-binding NarL/FixJ family response regulator|nr:response regulator transcription factor [Burkholderiales bacterium]